MDESDRRSAKERAERVMYLDGATWGIRSGLCSSTHAWGCPPANADLLFEVPGR